MTPLDIVAVAVLLALSASFSGSEAALFSLDAADREHLRARGGRAAATALWLLERPRRLLTTILLGNMAVNTALIARLETLAETAFGRAGLPLAIAASTILLLIFGEITPQRFSIRHRRLVALAAALPLAAMYAVFRPLVDGAATLTRRVVEGWRFGLPEDVTEEEIVTAVEDASASGALNAPEGLLVRGALALDERRASDLMVPREKIVALPKESTTADVRETVRRTGHTRIPVYSGSIDIMIGVVHVKDLLQFLADGREAPVAKILRPIIYVPRWRKANDLLRELQRRRAHLAIVVDEFGATAGLVTIENLIDVLIGRAGANVP